MPTFCPIHRRDALFWMAIAAATGPVVAATSLDVLSRSAQPTTRAARSVLIAVARAGKRLVAVGERGVVVYSDDDGSTWKQGVVPVSVTLTAVQFVTERLGWAVGHSGVVLHSEDGGTTWRQQLDGAMAAKLVLQDATKAAAVSPDEATLQRLSDAQRLVAEGPDKPWLCLRSH